jgi:Domain of unknown function (DUF4158)
MKQDWHPDELAQHWTLSPDERELLGNKSGTTRLSFAILLKTFQFQGRFPDRCEDVAGSVVAHLASQTDVPPGAYFDEEWSERTQTSAPRFASISVSGFFMRKTNPPSSRGRANESLLPIQRPRPSRSQVRFPSMCESSAPGHHRNPKVAEIFGTQRSDSKGKCGMVARK